MLRHSPVAQASEVSPDEELAALISEQERDAQWGHRVDARGTSLDFAFEGGGTFGDIVGYEGAGGDVATRKIPRPQKWTRQAIVKHIRAWVAEHGYPPTCKEWNAPKGRGFPVSAAVIRHFGSWDAAIEEAGFRGRGRGGHRHMTPGPKVRPRIRKTKCTARFSSDDLASAWVLYDRRKMSVREIAELLWEARGYGSPQLCTIALRNAFIAEGFCLRTKSEARLCLSAETRREISRRMHEGRALRGQVYVTPELAAEICARRGERQVDLAAAFGVSQSTIGRVLRGEVAGV